MNVHFCHTDKQFSEQVAELLFSHGFQSHGTH